MRKLILSLAATPLILGSIAVSAQAADDVATGAAAPADAGFNIFSDVKFKGELRPRYELRNQEDVKNADGSDKTAGSAITNRTNLNFSSKLFEVDGLNAEMELNAVNDFGSEQQTDVQVGKESLGNVAKISQANISYTNSGATGLVGRKTVNLDNQRWVGSVGWKQNFQTLDLGLLSYATEDKAINVTAAYVYGVNAISDSGYEYGRKQNYDGVVGSGSTTSMVVNASYKIMDPIKLTGYAYLLGSVSDTYGISATGKIPVGESTKIGYRAEYAMQTNSSLEHKAAGKTKTVGANYLNVDVDGNVYGVLLGANYELLGANKDYNVDDLTVGGPALQTNLATKHKFNGWADQFLKTPIAGLQDLNFRVGYKFETAGKLLAVYHLFNSAEDTRTIKGDKTTDLGSEIDFLYKVSIPKVKGLGLLAKAALYSGGDAAQVAGDAHGYTKDQTMAWLQLDYKFATK